METSVPEPPAPIHKPSAYPTIKESWAFLGWYLLVMLVVGVPVFLLCEKALNFSRPATLVIVTISSNLALLGVLRRRAGSRWVPVRPLGKEQVWLYAALPLLVLAMVMVLSLLDLLHLPNWADASFKELAKAPVLAFVVLCVAAPVLEELLFRGVLLAGLLRNYPQRPWMAIGQSALLFGLIHGNPAQMVGTGLIGLLLGWLYYRTQSLWLCMATHALNNLLAFLGLVVGGQELAEKSVVDVFGSWWAYAGAVAAGALVLCWLLRRVQQTTVPAHSASIREESVEVTLPQVG
ncbi:CPBP family intramembrane glutamic endopeptidase [Hymenobacter guriensis]|uniref:CPBP family intramembrane metalloprotease n=1 Tax=Hymenobacter guriensis TaxID=2793065 RepID=A0ABS0L3W6_9BACT|nr:type II CAAX endopeptidase family protein [Hymenobacter guriensis]MBG8554830.1 CPBP family intramembrane metalloprotease [Hymenobacter guriensis]